MTIREITQVVDDDMEIIAQDDGETVADFAVKYASSIIDDILDMEIDHIGIAAAYKGSTTLTVEKAGTDGDDGGDTEPDDEEP